MIKLLGPEGIKQRMAEIQARMDQLNPPVQEGARFHNVLQGQLDGPIGKGGFEPFRPGAPNTVVTPVGPALKSMIGKAAAANGIPESLLNAVVSTESGYNPMARSKAGAMGLTQMMPATAAALGVTDPYDAEQNLMGGARYLKGLLERFGDVKTALAAYNAGPNRVKDASRPLPAETVSYVNKVMGLYEAGRTG